MAVVVGRMLAVLEAQTAQFEARLTAAGQQITRFTSTTTTARHGVLMMKSGLQALALEGLGGLPGPLARVASGLGALAGGPIVTGVLAAAGAIALVYKAIADQAARAAKENEDFIASLKTLGPHAAVIAAQLRVTNLQAQIQQAGTVSPGGAAPQFVITPQVIALQSQLATALIDLANATKEALKWERARTEELGRFGKSPLSGATLARLGQPFRVPSFNAPVQPSAFGFGPRPGFGPAFGRDITGSAFMESQRQKAIALAESLQSTTMRVAAAQQLLNTALEQGWITAQQRADAEKVLQQQLERSTKHANQLGVALAGAISAAVLGLARAQSPAGFAGATLSGAGGILSVLAMSTPQLAVPAAILQGIGGVFSLFDKSEDRRAQDAERAAERRHIQLMQLFKETEPIIVPVRSGDWSDPREVDALMRAIEDARQRRVGPFAGAGVE